MAGLLAGRVLADHFDRVTIVDRDRFPEAPVPRKGVPQAHHLHVLLMRGQLIFEQLFPGLRAELLAAGAPHLDSAADLAWLTPAGWGVRFTSGLGGYSCSRDLLEWSVHRRVAAQTRVRFLEDREVVGLLSDAGRRGVAGARVRSPNGPDGGAGRDEEVGADLVVDASGRGSKAPKWLAALGYPPPQETVVNAFLGYASRIYQRPDDFRAGWKALYVQSAPPAATRGGAIFPLEGQRWMVSLGGAGRDYPPTDEPGFLDFARSLPTPVLCDAIREARPLTPIYGYRGTENRLRHYERLPSWPERLVALGDSVCAFNPVYGQGMSIAAAGASALDRHLRARRRHDGDLTGLARRFQRGLARINAAPWLMATGEDFRVPATVGGAPGRATRFMHRYMDRVLLVATEDRSVRRVLLEVFHLLKPPSALFQPRVVVQVLRRGRVPVV